MEESPPSREELLSELAALRARVATLQSSAGNFRAMADSANEGIVVFLGGTRVYYNPRWLEITGYDAAAYEDSPFLARVHGDDRERVAASFDRLLAGEPPTADLRLRLINRAGDTRHLAAKMSRIRWHGQPAGMVLVEDVTERQRTQDALRESERHFAAAFENSPIPMSIVDTESGERKAANKRFLNVMGYSEAEYVGSNLFTQAYSIDRTRQQYAARRIRHDGYVFAYPLELRTKSGEIRSMLLNASLLNPQENALAIVAYMDVTERKQTEQALLESETLYRSVVSAMREGLVVQDTTDKILMANQSAANILGLTREQLLGRDSYDPRWQAYHLDGTPFNPNDHPSIVSLRTGRAVDNTPMDVHIGDGRRAIISINARPIMDAAGAISGAVATFADVTRQVEAERVQRRLTQQLEQQAQQLQRVMDSVPEGLLLIAGDGRILLANPTAQGDLALLAHGAAVGDRLRQLGDLSLDALLARPTDGLWHQLAYQNRAFELLAKPLSGNSETDGWVLLIRDVTMEKEIQQRVQQQERLAAVGQLAAGIAHDFNNILAVVTLYTDLSLLEHSLPANILQRFETIKKQAERATDLTRQILDFGRRSVMERAPLDLVSLLKEMVKLFERTLPENITLQLRYPHSPHALTVNGDVTRLQQVLMNLVVNARDAMPDGGSVRIDLQRLAGVDLGDALPADLARLLINGETSPAWARLSFRDSGPGIAPDILPHIFEPFYTTKEQSKGTGLGLAQVFGIIKQHDGEIDVVSDPGEGSTFFIYLPLLDANTGPPGQRQPSELPLGRGETILIVEDNAPMRQVLESSLQELNYGTRVAANGEEALRILQDQGDDVALVLTDLVMPTMGGKSLLEALQAEGLRHKVIAMTGHAMFAEKASILALGAVDWLNKPISLERLARVMARALGDR